jgi:hypothetical protein
MVDGDGMGEANPKLEIQNKFEGGKRESGRFKTKAS